MKNENHKLKTVSDVIKALNGPSEMGRIFNVGPSAVCNWRTLDRFPERLHMKIFAELVRRDLTVSPELVGLHEPLNCPLVAA